MARKTQTAASSDGTAAAPVPKLWPADKVERWPLTRLTPYPRNARTHSAAQVKQIAASMQQWGWTNPILVDEAGEIIAGHGRIEAAKLLGLASVPVMIAEGWTPAQKRAYVIADNQLALNADWDEGLLRSELAALKIEDFDIGLIGFDDAALSDLLGEAQNSPDADEAPEPPVTPVSRAGDLWILGCCAATARRPMMSRMRWRVPRRT